MLLTLTKPVSSVEMKSAIENLKASILFCKSTPDEISLVVESAKEFKMLPLLQTALAEISTILLNS